MTKMLTKRLKNFQWMNTRVGKGFFGGKMANLKVFIAKLKFAKHIVDSTSFTKTVKFSIEICSKMILIGNYTCSRSINEKISLYVARATHSRYYKHFAKHACDFSLILLETCNFLYYNFVEHCSCTKYYFLTFGDYKLFLFMSLIRNQLFWTILFFIFP